mgnify:CR=1 FL=1|jgi:hypothetical protein
MQYVSPHVGAELPANGRKSLRKYVKKNDLGYRFFSKRLPCGSKDEKTKCTSGNVLGLRERENMRSREGKRLS